MSENKNIHILLAEDSLEGILSAVSYAYKSRYGHEFNKIMISGEEGTMELFSEYIDVPSDQDAAHEVYEAIRSGLGLEFLEYIEYCALSAFEDRGEVIYRCLILGFANSADILNYRKADCINRLHAIYRNVLNETNHWREFLRFKVHDMSELMPGQSDGDVLGEIEEDTDVFAKSGEYSSAEQYRRTAARQFLTAVIEPRHKVVSLMLPYFADRYSCENFLIYDKIHDEAAIYSGGRDRYIVSNVSSVQPEILEMINSETYENAEMTQLWKIFYDTTFIKERENRTLQRSLMPLRFRGDMPEQK